MMMNLSVCVVWLALTFFVCKLLVEIQHRGSYPRPKHVIVVLHGVFIIGYVRPVKKMGKLEKMWCICVQCKAVV
jgi:hypothetical protein